MNRAKNQSLTSHQTCEREKSLTCRLLLAAQLTGVMHEGRCWRSTPWLDIWFSARSSVLSAAHDSIENTMTESESMCRFFPQTARFHHLFMQRGGEKHRTSTEKKNLGSWFTSRIRKAEELRRNPAKARCSMEENPRVTRTREPLRP